MVLRKDQLEASLHEEKKLIETGKLKEDSPLDRSATFAKLCSACRRGDLKGCQEAVLEGANINARDEFDYTPLILASLCGHYEVVQLLLEAGALCERDTFQGLTLICLSVRKCSEKSVLTSLVLGERCLYNALNDRIRNLLLAYDYSKTTDPLQPYTSHITSLLGRETPKTWDILVTAGEQSFKLHKFVLAARSPYFQKRLHNAPETVSWKLPAAIPPQAFEVAIRYLYLGELPHDVGGGPDTGFTEEQVLEGIDKISTQLEIRSLWAGILESGDRRLARQHQADEAERGRTQIEGWFRDNVLRHRLVVESARAEEIKWDRANGIYADVLLRADEDDPASDESEEPSGAQTPQLNGDIGGGIPVGPLMAAAQTTESKPTRPPRMATVFPAHKAMLLRSDFFAAMFSSGFAEAQEAPHLRIISVDCSPAVLERVLFFLWTDRADIPLRLAVDVLFAADMLLIERLKTRAAVIISTLGNGPAAASKPENAEGKGGKAATTSGAGALEREEEDDDDDEPLDPFAVLRAAWLLRVPRLEEFAARYFAYRLEEYIDRPDFVALVAESAARIQARQATDSIELVDDIRYYLGERFRLRFEGEGLEEMLAEEEAAGEIEGATKALEGPIEAAGGAAHARQGDEPDATAAAAATAGDIRTLDGELAGDEFASDAINYRVLLEKIDTLLERLDLDG